MRPEGEMGTRIIAPLYHTYGPNHFRFEVPSVHVDPYYDINFYKFKVGKFSRSRFTGKNSTVAYLGGTALDYIRLVEASYFLYKSKAFDVTWICRSLLSFENRVDARTNNIVYDFDDAVWLGEANHCFANYCRRALAVFAGNSFLANAASAYSKKVVIVPTSVETNRYRKMTTTGSKFTVGWIGGSGGFAYIQGIEKDLKAFFTRNHDARLLIVSDRYPKELTSLTNHIDFKEWNIGSDVSDINEFHVGIMPLYDTDGEKGKCSLKMLQYMACEVPVVVSAVGMNNEVMAFGNQYGSFGLSVSFSSDWVGALQYYHGLSQSSREKEGAAGRQVVTNHFSSEHIGKQISEHFRTYL